MTVLPTKSFDVVVSDIASGVQGRASALVNFKIGSVFRAIAEGYAGVFMWFQALVLQLLTACRLSTATGIDVDTFTADFMPPVPGTTSPRLGANQASGNVVVSRFTAGPTSVFVPVGALFTTNDGSQNNFTVTADPTNVYFAVLNNGYVLPPLVSSMIIPVQCVTPGSQGNISAGSLTQIVTTIVGLDAVTNANTFINGSDAEGDQSLKKRFSDYIMGLSRGDLYGTASALENVDASLQWDLTEGYNYDGSWRGGFYWIVADDGSGNPSPIFLQSIRDAAESVRPLGIQCAVFPPVVLWASISLNIYHTSAYDGTALAAAVSANINAQVNGLGVGNDLPWSEIAGWAYAIQGVRRVTSVLINGNDDDSASLVTSRPTQDGTTSMAYAVVKIQNVAVTPLLITPNVSVH